MDEPLKTLGKMPAGTRVDYSGSEVVRTEIGWFDTDNGVFVNFEDLGNGVKIISVPDV